VAYLICSVTFCIRRLNDYRFGGSLSKNKFLLNVIMQFSGIFVFSEFGQGFSFYLTDPLSGYAEFLADFFQGVLFAVL
jgi:hypothetical protein